MNTNTTDRPAAPGAAGPVPSSSRPPADDLVWLETWLSERVREDSEMRRAVDIVGRWLLETGREEGDAAPMPPIASVRDPRMRRDLEEMVAHGRPRIAIKAETCRWIDQRRRLEAEIEAGGEDAPAFDGPFARERDLIRRAKSLPACFLWMLRGLPREHDALALAEAYEGLGAALELFLLVAIRPRDGRRRDFEDALTLVAECVSSTRSSVLEAEARPDPDVDLLFNAICHVTSREQVFIARHMRLEDPAPSGGWPRRRERLERLRARIDERGRFLRDEPGLLGRFADLCARVEEFDRPPEDAHVDAVEPDDLTPVLDDIRETLTRLLNRGFDLDDPDMLDAIGPAEAWLDARAERDDLLDALLDRLDGSSSSDGIASNPEDGETGAAVEGADVDADADADADAEPGWTAEPAETSNR